MGAFRDDVHHAVNQDTAEHEPLKDAGRGSIKTVPSLTITMVQVEQDETNAQDKSYRDKFVAAHLFPFICSTWWGVWCIAIAPAPPAIGAFYALCRRN